MGKTTENEKKGYEIVVKANELVQLSETKMSLAEMRAFAYVISQLDHVKQYNEDVIVSFYRSDFYRAIGISGRTGSSHKNFNDAIEQLFNSSIIIPQENGRERKYHLLYMADYANNNNAEEKEKVKIGIHKDILPLLTNLKKNFTKYRLDNVLGLKSKHAFRLYEFLKSFHGGIHTVSIERLKKICPGEYETVADYIRKTIAPAIKEINEKTDLFVEWDKKKNGRFVVAIVFNVIEKQAIDEDGDVIDEVVDEEDEFGADETWTQLSFDDVAATEVPAPSDDE